MKPQLQQVLGTLTNMIITYLKNKPAIEDCQFHLAIPNEIKLVGEAGKLYLPDRLKFPNPVVNDTARIGWFAVPEQQLSSSKYVAMPRTIKELNLTYFKPGELEIILAKQDTDLYAEITELKENGVRHDFIHYIHYAKNY